MNVIDLVVKDNVRHGDAYVLLRLSPVKGRMPDVVPGQFVMVNVPGCRDTFLRRPISINYADQRELWLLIRRSGVGTNALCDMQPGTVLSVILPLGRGFTLDVNGSVLLVGGGVGVAPLLMLGKRFVARGVDVKFLLGARTSTELLQLDLFRQTTETHVATEDGSLGHHGLVSTHPLLAQGFINHIACCGPLPMMQAVARIARQREINCEVSLENHMACGMGVCLCCVEDTVDQGNVRVCKEGPVFNINQLRWT